ncbi:MAG: branched-chain amino acid ABC transporter permease [Actinophytocola sp.]|nr:branched-chain amino acid ABC transporter permease [Actinophytocola sp.]
MFARLTALLVLTFIALLTLVGGAAAQDGEAVRGTIRGPDGDPVVGVTITAHLNGEEVGSTETGDDGTWQIDLPEPGTYEVRLDPDTLPEDLIPRRQSDAVRPEVKINAGKAQAVLFPVVDKDDQGAPDPGTGGEEPPPDGEVTEEPPLPREGAPFLERLAQVLVNGIQYGAVIAISAVGLSLIFGTTRLINFAHGELVTIGAVAAFFFNASAAGPGMHLIAAGILAILIGGLVGGGLERGLWRPLRGRGTGRINLFIISIGLSLLLRHVILVFFGSRPGSYTDYNIQPVIRLGPISATPRDLAIVVISVVMLFAVALMLQKTRIGTAIRAVSDDRDLASSSGINVNRVVLVVWILGGALASLGGVMFGLAQIVTWDMGFKLLLLMFAGIILGGLGSAYGAMVGSFVVGIVAHLSTLWFPIELQNAWALLVLIVVLLVRPQGILGRKERVG